MVDSILHHVNIACKLNFYNTFVEHWIILYSKNDCKNKLSKFKCSSLYGLKFTKINTKLSFVQTLNMFAYYTEILQLTVVATVDITVHQLCVTGQTVLTQSQGLENAALDAQMVRDCFQIKTVLKLNYST